MGLLKEAADRGAVSAPRRRAAPPLLAAVFVAAALLASVGGVAWTQLQTRTPAPAVPYRVSAEPLSDPMQADLSRMTEAVLVRVVDGDTVVVLIDRPPEGLADKENVRLIGVDAPELARGGKAGEIGGPAARVEAERLLAGKAVLLAFDRDLRDRYNRILAYLYSPGGACLNRELVASGAAGALLKYPFAFSDSFAEAEREAREARRGMWAVE